MRAAGILGTGAYLPETIIHNDDLVAKGLDTSDEWVYERTGIHERRVCLPEQATSDLAVGAAQRALDDAKVSPADIDLVIVATTTPDHLLFPSTACLIQDRLGITDAGAFDLSAACSGFNYSLTTAAQFVATGQMGHVLVVAADCLSKFVDWTDRSTCILFGDGAGAAVVGPAPDGYGILGSQLRSDGSLGDILNVPSGGSRAPLSAEGAIDMAGRTIHMNGRAVMKAAVHCVGPSVEAVLADAGLSVEDIDMFVPHQANVRIINAAAERFGLSHDKVFINIDRYGNTSAASVPIGLSEAVQAGQISRGDIVVTCGFGAGFTWATNVMKWI